MLLGFSPILTCAVTIAEDATNSAKSNFFKFIILRFGPKSIIQRKNTPKKGTTIENVV